MEFFSESKFKLHLKIAFKNIYSMKLGNHHW